MMKLEDYLDEEFKLLGVTPHITHLRLPEDSYFTVVTVASKFQMAYPDVFTRLSVILANAHVKKRSDLGTYLIQEFDKCENGVALCHHLDQFNRERGRIIAKGRLLKALRAARFG